MAHVADVTDATFSDLVLKSTKPETSVPTAPSDGPGHCRQLQRRYRRVDAGIRVGEPAGQ